MNNVSPEEEENPMKIASSLEPWLFRLALLTILVGAAWLGYVKVLPHLYGPPVVGTRIVVFDAVKLANAQRKLASAFIGGNASAAPILMTVQENTRSVIRKIAGPGTLVLLKQAVVHTEVPDITDDVLRALKLPTDVPTMDAGSAVLDYTPTILGITPRPPSSVRKVPTLPPGATTKEILP